MSWSPWVCLSCPKPFCQKASRIWYTAKIQDWKETRFVFNVTKKHILFIWISFSFAEILLVSHPYKINQKEHIICQGHSIISQPVCVSMCQFSPRGYPGIGDGAITSVTTNCWRLSKIIIELAGNLITPDCQGASHSSYKLGPSVCLQQVRL